jgi:hypothetical protein
MPSTDNCRGFTVASCQQLLEAAVDPARAAAKCRQVGATIALSASAQHKSEVSKCIAALMRHDNGAEQFVPLRSWQHGQNAVNKPQREVHKAQCAGARHATVIGRHCAEDVYR